MRALKKYGAVARVHFQSAVAYKASILSRFLFYTLFIYVFMRLWTAIYRDGSVSGYSLNQIVWYLIMTELIVFGLGTNIYQQMNSDVRDGSIAYLIGRPVHYVLYQYAGALGHMAVNLSAFAPLAALLGLLFVGPLKTFSLGSLPYVLVSMGLGLALHFFFHMLIGLSAFVLEDNAPIYLIYQKLSFMLGVFLPVEFLPDWLARVAKSLPFSYVAWAPARLFVNFSPASFWSLAPRQALWLCVALGATMLAYRGAVKRLQINGG